MSDTDDTVGGRRHRIQAETIEAYRELSESWSSIAMQHCIDMHSKEAEYLDRIAKLTMELVLARKDRDRLVAQLELSTLSIDAAIMGLEEYRRSMAALLKKLADAERKASGSRAGEADNGG